MTKKLLVLFALLGLFVSACGSATTSSDTAADGADQDTSGASDEQSAGSDEEMADGETTDGAMADGEMSDGAMGAAAGTDTAASSLDSVQGTLGGLLFADTLESDAVTSARFEGRFSITGEAGSELPGTFEILLSGGFDMASDAMELSMDMSELIIAASEADSEQIPEGFETFFADPIQIRVIGEEGWMKWGLLAMFTGVEDAWLSLDADEVGSTTEGFGFSSGAGDPTELLTVLADANADVQEVGSDMVRGVATTHYRALVDLEQLSHDATPAERAELEAQFGSLDQTAFPMDVWVGVDDGLVYRYVIDMSSEAFFDASDGEVSAATMSFEFYDYGADLGIVPPPADEVVDGESVFTG